MSERVIDYDLAAAIRSEPTPAERFAPNAPVQLTLADGEWSDAGSERVWRLRLTVAEARTMSFHAAQVSLPAGSQLSVAGAGARFTATASWTMARR